MTNVWKILFGIAVGLAIAGWLFWGVQGCTNKKVVQSLNDVIKACQNAPVKVVTVIKHDTVHDTKWYTPKTVVIHDTVQEIVRWCKQDYSDVYTFGKGDSTGSFTYNIHDRDCIPKINFSNFNYPVIHKTITKTVLKDTTHKQPTFRWGPYVGMPLNSFTKLSGVEIGAQVVVKDQLTVSAGLLITNGAYGNITVGWLFKK
jgi:hypothetical protein